MADRRLQVFFAVAKQGSFTRAAESLFMTQPAVTFQIKQLEEEFNCRLFERQHQKIALTPAGELVLEYASKILALSDEMQGRLGELTGEMGGSLAIGASTTLGEGLLEDILGDFNAQHPQVRLQLVVGNTQDIARRTVEGLVDVAFVEGPVPEKLVFSEFVGETRLMMICDPKHPLAGRKSVAPAELVEYEFIAREPGSGVRAVIEAYFVSSGVTGDRVKAVMELGSPATLKGVVKSGIGLSVLPGYAVAGEVARGELVAVPLEPMLLCPLYVLLPKERFRSRTISAFTDFVKRRLQAARS